MILYKYRSLANFEHVLDIILNQRLYCSTYPELNDPFEGIYRVTYFLLKDGDMATKENYKNVEESVTGKIKICSLSLVIFPLSFHCLLMKA